MILGGRSCPTPRRTASTSRNPSAAVFSSLVHDRRDHARCGPLTLVPLRSVWRLACGDRAAPGPLRSSRQTAGLTPCTSLTHHLQTHRPIDGTAHAPCRTRSRLAPSIRAAADGPCEDAYSIRSPHSPRWGRKTADRQEGRGRACLCVVRLSHRRVAAAHCCATAP